GGRPLAPLRLLEPALGERYRLAPHRVAEVGLRVGLPGRAGSRVGWHLVAEAIERRGDDRLPILGAEAFEAAEGAVPGLPSDPARFLLDARRAAREAARALRELPHDPAPPRHPEADDRRLDNALP